MRQAENETRQTMQEFCDQHGITMTAEQIAERSDGLMDEGDDVRSHWRCIFRRDGHRLTVYYSMGSAHTEPPQCADVLSSCHFDAQAVEWESMDGFLQEMEYTDSLEAVRRGEKVYRACERMGEKLARFLGAELFAALADVEPQ